MTIEEIEDYYGSYNAAAAAIGISRQNFVHWKKRKGVPLLNQFKYEKITEGILKADKKHAAKLIKNQDEL